MDTGGYRDILRACFPQLAISSIRYLAGGTFRVFEVEESSDCDGHWAVNNSIGSSRRLVFRFPHGGEGDRLLRYERHLCEALSPLLPISIPHYAYYSEGCRQFPRYVAGYQMLPGTTLQDCRLDQAAWRRAASQIGRFLSALHSISPTEIQTVQLKRLGPAQVMTQQQSLYSEISQYVYPVLGERELAWTGGLFESFLADPVNLGFKPVLIHGDLDSSNILCDRENGTLLGIIDFEDTCLGDPAWDFCVLAAEHGPAFLRALLSAYLLPLDASFLARVVFHSRRILFLELLYGVRHGDKRFSQHALERLQRAMAGLEPIGGWMAASTAETRILESYPS